jgi:Zn-dependent protease with chaperone function
MKIVNRRLRETADESSARHQAIPELRRLLIFVTLLAIGLYLTIGLIVDAVVPRISFETEAKLFGNRGIWPLKDEEDDERLGRVSKVLEALREDSAVPPLPYALMVIEHDKPNAFAFPGGTIGVTTALLDVLEEDVELAFVIGHELGHFYNRDHLRGMGRAIGVGLTYAILFGGEMGVKSLGNILQYVLQRGYSRVQEENADSFGVGVVFRVYGKTDGIEKLFEILEGKKDLPEWAYMFSTHPSPSQRIRDLKRYADELSN